MNSKAKAITGMLKSTPVLLHPGQARLPTQGTSLSGQTRYEVGAITAGDEHPVHQLVSAHFWFDGLHACEGITTQRSSMRRKITKTLRPLAGSRFA